MCIGKLWWGGSGGDNGVGVGVRGVGGGRGGGVEGGSGGVGEGLSLFFLKILILD